MLQTAGVISNIPPKIPTFYNVLVKIVLQSLIVLIVTCSLISYFEMAKEHQRWAWRHSDICIFN